MKRLFVCGVIAAVFTFSGTLNAQVVNSIIRSFDAASAGLSGAGVAMPANAYALDVNPASMSLSEQTMAAGAGFGILNPSSVKMLAFSASGYYTISSKIAAGVGVKHLSYEPYPTTAADGRVTGEYTPTDMSVTAGFSYKLMEGLAVGAAAKVFSLSLAEDSATTGFCLDLGAQYRSDALSAGVNFRNIASSAMHITAGAAYEIAGITASAQIEHLAGAGIMAALGAQYSFKDMVFARGGFHYGNATTGIPSYGSLGIGAKFAGITLDAAILLGTATVSGTTLFTLGYAF